MSKQIAIRLPDKTYERLQALATRTDRNLAPSALAVTSTDHDR